MKEMDTVGTLKGKYEIVTSYNIVPIQSTRVVSSLRYVRPIIGFDTMCTGIILLVINDKVNKNEQL